MGSARTPSTGDSDALDYLAPREALDTPETLEQTAASLRARMTETQS